MTPAIFCEIRFVASYFQQMILHSKIFEIIDTNNSLYSIFGVECELDGVECELFWEFWNEVSFVENKM